MPTQFGRYEVIRRLPGEPERYLARAQGPEAYALLRIGPASEQAIAQAEREVRICGALGHSGIAAAIEAFADGDRLVVASPDRDGVTLEQLFARLRESGEPLAGAAVWHLAGAVAGALGAAHEAADGDDVMAISHGFLSPEWIAIGWDGSVLLAGLGLSALSAAFGAEVGYLAPEQRQSDRVTPRGDIYALGAVVWALLTGRIPPEEPSIEAVAPRAPAAIVELLRRALAPSLAKRKITAAELELGFGEVAAGGRQELVKALEPLRKTTSVMGTPRRAGGTMAWSSTGKAITAGAASASPAPAAAKPAGPAPAAAKPAPSRRAVQGVDDLSWTVRPEQIEAAMRAMEAAGTAPKGITRPAPAAVSPRASALSPKPSPAAKPSAVSAKPAAQRASGAEASAPKPDASAGKRSSGPLKAEAAQKATAIAAKIDRAVDAVLNDESPSWVDREVPSGETLAALQAPPSSAEPPTSNAPPADAPAKAREPGVANRQFATLGYTSRRSELAIAAKSEPVAPKTEAAAKIDSPFEKPGAKIDSLVDEPAEPGAKIDSQFDEPAEPAAKIESLVDKPGKRADPDIQVESVFEDLAEPAEAAGKVEPVADRLDVAEPQADRPAEIAVESEPAAREPSKPEAVAAPLADAKSDAKSVAAQSTDAAASAAARPAAATGASPWSQKEANRQKPLSIAKLIGLSLATAVAVVAAGLWRITREHSLSPPEPSSLASETAAAKRAIAGATAAKATTASTAAQTSAPAASAAAENAAAATSAAPTASAAASAAPAASASATASAAASAAPDETDASLPANEAHLTVQFSGDADAQVFFFANPLGKVGEQLTVPCDKMMFIRVGKRDNPTEPPRWLDKGRSYKAACQKNNVLTVEPR